MRKVNRTMTTEDDIILKRLNTRVRQLILQYQAQAEKIAALQAELAEKEDRIVSLTQTCDELRQNYANLKLARMIEVSDADIEEARTKLSRLAREVNKCIALMSV